MPIVACLLATYGETLAVPINPATEDVTETDFETFNQVVTIETIEEIEAKLE